MYPGSHFLYLDGRALASCKIKLMLLSAFPRYKVSELVESSRFHRVLSVTPEMTLPWGVLSWNYQRGCLPPPSVVEASHPSHPTKRGGKQHPESQLKHSSLAPPINQTACCIWKV